MTGRAASMTNRTASCDGKLTYESYTEAARRVSKKAVAKLEAYRCHYCGGYHIGNRRELQQERRTKEER